MALINVHRRDDFKAASDPKAAANLSELLFVADMFLEAENTAQEQKLHDLLVTGGDVPTSSGLPALPPRGGSWQVVRHDAFIPGSQLMHDIRFPCRLLDVSIPRILALACDQNASDRQWELFFDEMHASHRCATTTRPSRPGAPSHQAERGCSGLSPIR